MEKDESEQDMRRHSLSADNRVERTADRAGAGYFAHRGGPNPGGVSCQRAHVGRNTQDGRQRVGGAADVEQAAGPRRALREAGRMIS
jgi:hypothetical protein